MCWLPSVCRPPLPQALPLITDGPGTADDGLWRVELGNPRQTERSGFVEGVAKPGDQVTALGSRSQDPQEKRMKAVRITIGEKRYDIYPERIRTN